MIHDYDSEDFYQVTYPKRWHLEDDESEFCKECGTSFFEVSIKQVNESGLCQHCYKEKEN